MVSSPLLFMSTDNDTQNGTEPGANPFGGKYRRMNKSNFLAYSFFSLFGGMTVFFSLLLLIMIFLVKIFVPTVVVAVLLLLSIWGLKASWKKM